MSVRGSLNLHDDDGDGENDEGGIIDGASDNATVAVGGGAGREAQDEEMKGLEARLAELGQALASQQRAHEAALGKLSFLLRDGVMERLEQALVESEVR